MKKVRVRRCCEWSCIPQSPASRRFWNATGARLLEGLFGRLLGTIHAYRYRIRGRWLGGHHDGYWHRLRRCDNEPANLTMRRYRLDGGRSAQQAKHVFGRRSGGAHRIGIAITAQHQLYAPLVHRNGELLGLLRRYAKRDSGRVVGLAIRVTLYCRPYRQNAHVLHEQLRHLRIAIGRILGKSHENVDAAVRLKQAAYTCDIVDSHRHRARPRRDLLLEAGPCADRRQPTRHYRLAVEDGNARYAPDRRVDRRECSDWNGRDRPVSRAEREAVE